MFYGALRTRLWMSTTYHSLMNGLSERTNQALDEVLRARIALMLEEVGVCIYLS